MLLNYVKPYHKKLPHVLKFSGGRSSGYLLFQMLESGLFNKDRGDIVLFNNTSAEHPKTYDFVIKCKERCEKQYGIPFFLSEFQTYEDMNIKHGFYDRFDTYRLVNTKTHSLKNPNGYKWKGEVFEEIISSDGFLPTRLQRTCSRGLKTMVSLEVVKDWLHYKIDRLGHFKDHSLINIESLYSKHQSNGGNVPFKIFKSKKEFVLKQKLYREEQSFQDYTNVDLSYRQAIFDEEYVVLIGFRSDEPMRLLKMRNRLKDNYNSDEIAYVRDKNEHLYMPMIDWQTTKETVKNFWNNADFDLGLPYDGSLGNCVYCFMKGSKKLQDIKIRLNKKIKNTPSDIQWWINIEQKYQRDLEAEKREIRKDGIKVLNFFGSDEKASYTNIKNGKKCDVGMGECLNCFD